MIIRDAAFIKSSTTWKDCPPPDLPEYAFIGRSNVGKSSLINALMNRKDLAKTSQTPGKTQLINHFLINNQWYLTDLPGYGYARVSKKMLREFGKLIEGYILNRKNLVNLFILIDIRHEPQKVDLEFIEWCGISQIPLSLIFTKADKLKPGAIKNKAAAYEQKLLAYWEVLPQTFITSAVKKEGGEPILDFIEETNQQLEDSKIRFS